MPPWLNAGIRYFPILRFKPGETLALGNLPRQDKQRLAPLIPLRKVGGAKNFERTTERLSGVRGDSGMSLILDVDDDLGDLSPENPAHVALNQLRDPQRGFRYWRNFISSLDYAIPAIQAPEGVSEAALVRQVQAFEELDRGMVLRLRRGRRDVLAVAGVVLNTLTSLDHLLLVIDLGHLDANIHVPMLQATALTRQLLEIANGEDLHVVCAASSFPKGFDGLGKVIELPIWERQLIEEISRQPGLNIPNLNLLYGDYGSARAEELKGPSRRGPPRVDYATRRNWLYSRQYGMEKDEGLPLAAQAIIDDERWDDDLHIWGAEKIRELAGGELSDFGASYAVPAVRINLHLHAQIYADAPRDQFLDTDEEWVD